MSTISVHPILEFEQPAHVAFTFDGQPLWGVPGEPIAAALLANGVSVFRHTEKTHSPRGLFCGIGQCSDCVVVVNGQPNVRSCTTLLEEGMRVETQHGFGKVGVL